MSVEIKSKTILEVKTGEFCISLEFEPNASLGALFDAVSNIQAFIVERIKSSQPHTAETPATAEVPEVV